MINEQIILTDCDGVCLDWEHILLDFTMIQPVGEDWKMKYKVSDRFVTVARVRDDQSIQHSVLSGFSSIERCSTLYQVTCERSSWI